MKNKLQILVTVLFLGFAAWWLSFQHVVTKGGDSVQWFGSTYGVLALIAAVIGFVAAQKWGGFKTILGKSLMFFSLGVLAQEAGQLIYAYYIYGAKIDIPFPSWGDAAYFGSVLLYIAAAFFLSHASGVKFSLKDVRSKLIAIIIPVALLALSGFMFLYHHDPNSGNALSTFLNFGYPLGQALYISIAITAYLLSRKMLGGVMKRGIILIICALVVQYVADFTFLYLTSRGKWVVGEYNDLMYLTAYFVMATALIQFIRIHQNLRSNLHAAAAPPAAEAKPDEPSSDTTPPAPQPTDTSDTMPSQPDPTAESSDTSPPPETEDKE